MSLRLSDNLLNHYSSSFHGNANADFFDAANYARVQFREREALVAEVFKLRARTLERPSGSPTANLPSETPEAFLRRIYQIQFLVIDDEEAVIIECCQCGSVANPNVANCQ